MSLSFAKSCNMYEKTLVVCPWQVYSLMEQCGEVNMSIRASLAVHLMKNDSLFSSISPGTGRICECVRMWLFEFFFRNFFLAPPWWEIKNLWLSASIFLAVNDMINLRYTTKQDTWSWPVFLFYSFWSFPCKPALACLCIFPLEWSPNQPAACCASLTCP